VAGGGLYVQDVGSLAIADSTFSENTAARGMGLAVTDVAGGCSLLRVDIAGNAGVGSSEMWGGAAWLDADCAVTDGAIHENTAPDAVGGGLVVIGHVVVLVGTRVHDNLAAYGGGVAVATSELGNASLVTDDASPIDGNRAEIGNADPFGVGADALGGGVLVVSWKTGRIAHVSGLTLTDNQAEGSGGGLAWIDWSHASRLELRSLTATGNSAGFAGGGLYLYDPTLSTKGGSIVEISHSTLVGNDSDSWGGGIAAWQLGALALDESLRSRLSS
jgi:hypothetical protein